MKKIQLSIPEPCHENWNQMLPDEKGRFCNACQKTVLDFTSMSDRQLAQFFKNYSGSVCGRMQQDQLMRDIQIPKKRIPWLRYFFQFSIPALLVSAKASAQGKIAVIKNEVACKVGETRTGKLAVPQAKAVEEKIISGNVTDENGKPLYGATVYFRNTHIGVSTDSAGNFKIKALSDSTPLMVSMVGYMTREVSPDADFIKIQMINDLRGEVVVVAGLINSKPNRVPLIQKIADSVFTNFSVFPNPVKSNSTLNIRKNQFKNGKWKIEIFNDAGALVQSKEVDVESKTRLISFEVVSLPAGVYFIRMKDMKSRKVLTEKIMVE